MSAKKLTKAEQQWLHKVEALFKACPSNRLGFYTIGDATLFVYDKPVAKAWEEAQGYSFNELDAGKAHQKAGSMLHEISTGTIQIDSCAG